MKKFSLYLKWGLIPLFIAAAAAIFALFGSYAHTEYEKIYLTPGLDDPNGWEIYTVEDDRRIFLTPRELLELELDRTFYISRTLTDDIRDRGCTLLNLDRPSAVFLDGELIYTNCTNGSLGFDSVIFPDDFKNYDMRSEHFYCTLPENYVGKQLTIALKHFDHQGMPSVIMSSLMIGTAVNSAEVSGVMIPAVGFAVTALLLLGIWIFGIFHGIRSYAPLLVIAAAMSRSLSCLRRYEYISNSPTAMDTPFTVFVPIIALFLPQLYFLFKIEKKSGRIIYGCILGVTTAVAAALQTAEYFGASVGMIRNGLLYLSLAALTVFAVLEAKNRNNSFRLFLGGAGIILAGIIVLYTGSAAGSGYYSDSIRTVFTLSTEYGSYGLINFLSGALFILSAVVNVYYLIIRTSRIQTDLAVQNERLEQLDRDLEVQKQFYESKLSSEKEIRSLRHDMNGHLATLSALIRDNRTDEAANYLAEITELHREVKKEHFSSDPYIDTVLNEYRARCEKNNISFVCRIGTDNHSLPCAELCLILNNALENAYEASMKLPEKDRYIKVQSAVQQNRFLLRVSNRFEGTVSLSEGLPVTEKPGKEHGYGLSNILRTVQRKGGTMDFRTENGVFVMDVQFSLM